MKIIFTLIVFLSTTAYSRTILMNGTDISSARNQDLKGVDVHINDKGEIFITAPHYSVHEEETFVPLSSSPGRANPPMHQPPKELGVDAKEKSTDTIQQPAAQQLPPSSPAVSPGPLNAKNGTPATSPKP